VVVTPSQLSPPGKLYEKQGMINVSKPQSLERRGGVMANFSACPKGWEFGNKPLGL
jgi:hypothetical protein